MPRERGRDSQPPLHRLASDNVFGNDRAAHQLATVTGDVTGGYVATLTVGV